MIRLACLLRIATCLATSTSYPRFPHQNFKMSVLRPFRATDLFKFNNMYAISRVPDFLSLISAATSISGQKPYASYLRPIKPALI